jgi:2-oxoisovalerate dehydrogenase E1 component
MTRVAVCVRYNVCVMGEYLTLYQTMLLIRRFEERLLSEFSSGKLVGTTHAYIGQEADAAGIFSVTDPEDVVFSNHRCHGHFLAYGGEPYRLAAELMGKSTGLVGGRGGSQHIHWRNFYSNGIQGGIVPVATGMALAEKQKQTGKVTLVFIGDGTLGEGALYESLNIAALWSLPILFVLEDNRYAQTTPVEKGVAGSMAGRFAAFGIPVWELESSDVLEIQPAARQALQHARSGKGPASLILHTYRFSAHSKGDDPRSPDELARIRQFDPLTLHAVRMTAEECARAETEVSAVINDAFTRADSDPFPVISVESPVSDVRLSSFDVGRSTFDARPTVLERINFALHHAMETDDRVYVLGEDILDPYGGAFKVTRGLSTKFPQRVLTTPISEAGIIGAANGMALRGMRPVAEIMFGDFVTLIADQLVNHASKFRWMYNDQVRVPLVVRAPMGGRRGYGPTHSQSLEKMFLGAPGLKVVAPNALGDPAALLRAAIADDDPVLFVEHKLLYTRPLLEPGQGDLVDYGIEKFGEAYPVYVLRMANTAPHLTIATYGYNFELARAAAIDLMMEHEIFAEIVLFSQLSPFDLEALFPSLARTKRLLTVEEGSLTLGWGAEVAAQVAEFRNGSCGYSISRVAALDVPIANAKSLEDAILPTVQGIVEASLGLVER